MDGMPILKFKEGNVISLINGKPQTIEIQLQHLQLQNVEKVIKSAGELIKNPLVKQLLNLHLIVEEE